MTLKASWGGAVLALIPAIAALAPAGEPATGRPPQAAAAEPAKPPARPSAKGRFLYANDDDWDWPSPKGRQTTRLHVYGVMDWSALDWIEEGLPEVRGLVVGTLPVDYLGTDKIDVARGRENQTTYACAEPRPGLLAKKLAAGAEGNYNVLLMMRNLCTEPAPDFTPADLEALAAFVQRGGRAIVMDDWGIYRAVLERMLAGGALPEAAKPPGLPDGLRQKAGELVKRLGDDDWATREQATRELTALGRDILPFIAGLKSDDAEVAFRLERVVAELAGDRSDTDPAAKSLTNEELDALLPRARTAGASAEMRNLERGDAATKEGRALLMEFPQAAAPKSP